ncbi:MAG: D-alanine-D-alanine ligase [Parcubacteria group bacterium GW2011_GWC1_42_11]|uniref:D-alanine--D-alanine ligase n=1 Tax=Candidatus Nomurabacteria bacterium GW2011_GWC2_42_20 TaxID=1618756 RepID=A0A0G1BQ93_9BACT|nr:MAG: D-alanine-D-alanine ligase [Parcubacteria group bacterium GW2011_GWC1_42_11]KKS48411.1 MAG: D-alanine-D-alanine ligase [Candidatus Nomurabacteria bacterium GW2011_GWC2_42_20]KKS59432.1 MAG: D-alanine-D-alanine ligase [Candidatus Nomurabacteria bacterium GW2011_GWA2_42_41]KKT09987.1 MAG: D-alanine-D-alanine ligase [Candidatus Nomurabacteria bacterium GW2011_GWB1_43_20]TAN36037.1 MAG: D-alanine--D-alanine ligase [Patescibacteria group bacterium]HBH71323.1 D-alanine--D-alanine ligase [Can
MTKLRVGVMRGGLGPEYHVSLRTGGNVLAALVGNKYEAHDILITNVGEWHIDGVPTTPSKLSQHVDVVFNALHGEFGEDGKVQKILEIFNIPYTGSTVLPSAIGMNKDLAKKYFSAIGIKVPHGIVVARGEEVGEVITRVGNEVRAPWVVKPLTGGSSVGISLANDSRELVSAIEGALAYSEKAIIEEYVRGREVTVGVVDSSDGLGSYATPPLEVLLPEGKLFDYDQKYKNLIHPVGPARMSSVERRALEEVALRAHVHLGARHYARYDFIMTDDGPCLLEVNTLPGLTNTSLLMKSLSLNGLTLPEFIDYVLTLALTKK